MQNVPVREQIRRFLEAAAYGSLPIDPNQPDGPKHAPAANADILQMYSPEMEVQVNVAAGDGTPVEGRRNTWERDGQEYWHIRCPKGAMDNPHWQDYQLRWSLIEHAEAVGMTGWDWANRKSRWVAFDFDAITGHAPGVGVTDERLQAIREAAFSLPYVQVRKSTRGGGYHLYVFFCEWSDGCWLGEGVACENHTIHAALGRCILAKMSQEANFNFASAIDACGGNMWVWHRDANKGNEGFALIKEASATFTPDELPPNWRDHVDVVTRKRTKIKIRGVPDSQDEDFDTLASGRNVVPLDESHNSTIERLYEAGFTTIWVPEYNLLQTHTCAFAHLMEEYKEDYQGFFETNSSGDNPDEPNCFAFPIPDGGWRVVRFSKGIREHETWEQDGINWTSCYFNCRPDLEAAALSMGGAEISGTGGFEFETLRQARRTVLALGGTIDLPEDWDDREARLKKNKSNGRLVVMVRRNNRENKPGRGWIEKRDWWEKVFKVDTDSDETRGYDYPEFDNVVRALVTPGGEHAGWAVKKSNKDGWDLQPTGNVKLALRGHPFNVSQSEVDVIMGGVLNRRWDLVNLPFQPEFPGDRQWNFKAPQLRYAPAKLGDDEIPKHPYWDRVLNHIGQDMDEPILEHLWASRYGIKSGREYLQLWIACMIREPFEPLPYLFLWGPENSGKSIFHEALSKLMVGGIAYADKALTTTSEFNGELANAVLAVVEETDVAQAGDRARNRMKDWVTSEFLSIRRMRTDAYLQKNTLHFVQCSNSSDACLVQYGDTRTTVLYVPELLGEEIPKSVLKRELEREAPHFMRTLMDLDIPPVEGRLRIPFVTTTSKAHMEQQNMNSLMLFIDEYTFNIDGAMIEFSEFYNKFHAWLPDDEKGYWTKRRVTKRLPSHTYPTGMATGSGQTHIGNISWSMSTEENEPLVLYERRLRPKSEARKREKSKSDND